MATWKRLTLVKTDHIEVDVNLDHVIYMVRELRGFFDLAPQKEQREATRRTADVPTSVRSYGKIGTSEDFSGPNMVPILKIRLTRSATGLSADSRHVSH